VLSSTFRVVTLVSNPDRLRVVLISNIFLN
jgi:hypothetical protein